MEDAFLVAYQQTEDEKDLEYAYFGIFDGHGGREAAQYAKDHLMNNIVSQKNFWSENDENVLRAIKDGFITTHLSMWKEVANWPKTMSGLPSTSGTTASIAFIRRGKMYTGHVGDSKIILGTQNSEKEDWYPRPLTKDHKPESPAERERIYSAGGCVMNKAGVERVVWYRPRLGHTGPVRRSTRVDRIPFLAVARSLGDLWSYNYTEGAFVVSPEPDVEVVSLDPKRDRCIVLASDGLWNMLSPRDAVSLVQETEEANELIILESVQTSSMQSKQASNPSKLLVDKALNRWYNLGMRADNTSVVTVLLDPPGPPKREVLLRQRVMQKLRPREEQLDTDSGYTENDSSEEKICKKVSSEDSNSLLKDKRQRLPSVSNNDTRCPVLPKPVVLTPKRVNPKRKSDNWNNVTPEHEEEPGQMCSNANCMHVRCEAFRKVMVYATLCRQATNELPDKDVIRSEEVKSNEISGTPLVSNENNSSLINEEKDGAKLTNIVVNAVKSSAIQNSSEGKRKWTENDNAITALKSNPKQLKTKSWTDVSNCRVAATRSLCTRSRLRTAKSKD